jgi:predicted nucleic acid-binding protein
VDPLLILIDTDVLIDVSHGVDDAMETLERAEAEDDPAISVITQLELVVGCRNQRELRSMERFFDRFRIIRANESISDKAVDLLRQYRLAHGLLLPDSLIAATALIHDVPFLTKNQKHFRPVQGLKLLPYPY